MRQAQINVRTRACSRTSIARTKQAALTHNVRGKELINANITNYVFDIDLHAATGNFDIRVCFCYHFLGIIII